MKKFLLIAAAASMGMAASAQTVIAPMSVADAQAAGMEALWGSYEYGYVLPNGSVVTDTDDIKVVVNNGSTSKPGANVAATGLNTDLFPLSFNMGSAAADTYNEPVYALEAVSEGIKQPYAIFIVEAKKGGNLTMYTNRSNKKYTMYVWDTTAGDGVGTYALASTVQTGDAGNGIVSEATVSLIEGHTYWIFGSGNGANINMYEMVYTPYASPDYSAKEFNAADYSTPIVPMAVDAAQAAGMEALWGSYEYGYVLPNGYVVTDTDDLKVLVDNGSSSKPGANVAATGLNTTLFPLSFNMGSAASDTSFEPVYALEAVSEGIKQPYAIFTVEAKKGGELTMFSNRSNKKYTMYVWDTTAGDGVGTYAMASTVQTGDAGNGLVSVATVGLIEGHKYWIFGSGNGANINMYAMGFNNYAAPNYGYTTTGIADVTVDAAPQSNVIYNFQGQIVDENYKGFVIKNGKKYLQK